MHGREDVKNICKLKAGPIASWAQMALASAADDAAGLGCTGFGEGVRLGERGWPGAWCEGRDLVEISTTSRPSFPRYLVESVSVTAYITYILNFKMFVCNPHPRILTLVSKPG